MKPSTYLKILGNNILIARCNVVIACMKAILAARIAKLWLRNLLKGEPRPDCVFLYRLALDPTYNPDNITISPDDQERFNAAHPKLSA